MILRSLIPTTAHERDIMSPSLDSCAPATTGEVSRNTGFQPAPRSVKAQMSCVAGLFSLLVLLLSATTHAQPMAPAPIAPSTVLKQVGVDQKLGEQLPLDLTFTDHTGKSVRLGDYFGKKPVLIAPVYYECPMLCTMTLDGLVRTLKPLQPTAGKDFEVIVFSFDPRETPALAAKKRTVYLEKYGREDAAPGWHYLTGDEASIKALAQAIGFRYMWDEATKQFAHASAIMLATPQGQLSKYFYGLDYSSRDLRLGLTEASENKIGGIAETLLLLCYHYDPASGKYSLAVLNIVRAGGILTVLGLTTFAVVMIRRERRDASQQSTPGTRQ